MVGMYNYSEPIARLINRLSRLPGIGPKSAQRLAFYLLNAPAEVSRELAEAILDARQNIRFCQRCCNLTTAELCEICRDDSRQGDILCVVEEPRDVAAFERLRDFKGYYHVLHGAIKPMEDIGPEQLKIKELLKRLQTEPIAEVIIATNPTIEGETTAMYLAKLLKPLGVRVTRLAHGLPAGSVLEYADEMTLASALAGRREI